MNKKKAKLIFKHNYFEIIEEGDYVLCALSGKEIKLQNLNYWNVDLQEAYLSPKEANERFQSHQKNEYLFPSIMSPNPLGRIFHYHFFKNYYLAFRVSSILLLKFLGLILLHEIQFENSSIIYSFNINRYYS